MSIGNACDRANTLISAGYALETIGNLLGADGCDYSLSKEQEGHLQHAVVALGALVRDFALEIYTDTDPNPIPAPRNAEIANRGADLSGGSLAERALAARERASLSQAELAGLVGVTQAAISSVESGESKRTAYLAELARACGVDIGWLAFGSGGVQ